MRQNKHLQHIFLLVLLACTTLMSAVPASAASVDGNASISALYLVDHRPVSDVTISAHRIATLDDDDIVWQDAYEKYHLTTEIQDSEGAIALAQTMAAYVLRDSIRADFQAKTGPDGYAKFESLPEGLYLITGSQYSLGRHTYSIVPTLVPLPCLSENGELNFHVEIELKHESIYTPPPSPSPGLTIRKVLKVWDLNTRDPEPISVNLLRNGNVYDTQVLSEENNWTYTWRGLDDDCFWTLVEESAPDGFSTLVTKQGATFVVTNTEEAPHEPTPPPPVDPSRPVTPQPTNPSEPTPTEPVKPSTPPETPSMPNVPKLPQTGMPMQAVFALLIISIVMAASALVCTKKKLHQLSCIMTVASLVSMLAAGYMILGNIQGDISAGKDSALVIEALAHEIPDVQADELAFGEELIPNYELDTNLDMPEVEIDGGKYIGTVEVPTLGLVLPVQSEWSKEGAAKAPCRYMGSVYNDDCIIAAHNFKSHFGNIKLLNAGDEVKFTDVEGNIFTYAVSETETLDGYDIEGMQAGDWDLTLFTCTPGGQRRVAVRCLEA